MIVRTDPEAVRGLAGALALDSEDLRRAISDVRATLVEASAQWKGEAARAFEREASAWTQSAERQTTVYDEALQSIRAYAARIGALREDEQALRLSAASRQLWASLPPMAVADDGVVTPHPDDLPLSIASPIATLVGDLDVRWQRFVAQYRVDHAQVSAQAADVRTEYLRANARLGADLEELQTFEGVAPAGAHPSMASFLSLGLTMGIASPISTWVTRAEANRARALRDLAAARRSGDTATVAMLRSLFAPGVSLLQYDPQRHHVVAVVGDLSTAQQVAVYVPGVEDQGAEQAVTRGMSDIERVWAAAGREQTAVVYWKGYTNPGDLGALDMAQAALAGRAAEGGASLGAFLRNDLPVVDGQSLTLMGHSYGSLVVGKALTEGGAQPDRVVVFGSPGVGVSSVEGLNLRADQFFSERAPDDWVANGMGGHGKDPAAPDFGGTRLSTNGPGYEGVGGHTDYLKPGSRSLDNIVRVISGGIAEREAPSSGDLVHSVVRNGALGTWSGSGTPEFIDNAVAGLANGLGAYAGVLTDRTAEVITDAASWLEDLVD